MNVTTAKALQSMRDVLAIAEQTTGISGTALQAAEEVGVSSKTLNREVMEFLGAMSGGSDADRRNYVRFVPKLGTQARLAIGGKPPVTVTVAEISRGGLSAPLPGVEAPPGTTVSVELPGGAVIGGRIARNANGRVAIAFAQGQAELAAIDRVLERVRTDEAA